MSSHTTGQVAASAAEVYEEFFVPAIFAEWPPRIIAAADIQPGQRVLDVACGTGVLARAVGPVVGKSGTVVGVDINDGMLMVARSLTQDVTWQNASADSLPFETNSFDRVVSQFGLMFFPDRSQAIAEMLRVVQPNGRVVVAVWASLEATPGYATVAAMLSDLFGPEVARSIEVPYCLGDIRALHSLFSDAGATEATIQTVNGKARFASVDEWMYTDVKGWTLADTIDEEGYERLRREASIRLSPFVLPDGSVEFSAPAHIVTVYA